MAKAHKEDKKEGVELYKTDQLAILETGDLKTLFKESEGKPIIFEDKEFTELMLTEMAEKLDAELLVFEEKKVLTPEDLARIKEIEKQVQTNRFSLQNIRSHNGTVFTKVNKDDIATIDSFKALIKPTEDKATELLLKEKTRIETEAANRKKEFDEKIDSVRKNLQRVVTAFTKFEQVDKAIDLFEKIQDNHGLDFEEFQLTYESMVAEMETKLQNKIEEITGAHELVTSQNAQKVSELKAARMEQLFDYDFKYKAEKPLGELTEEEYNEIMVPLRYKFRSKELTDLGLTFQEVEPNANGNRMTALCKGEEEILEINLNRLTDEVEDKWKLTVKVIEGILNAEIVIQASAPAEVKKEDVEGVSASSEPAAEVKNGPGVTFVGRGAPMSLMGKQQQSPQIAPKAEETVKQETQSKCEPSGPREGQTQVQYDTERILIKFGLFANPKGANIKSEMILDFVNSITE